jgi:Mg/Co/Ni transporter MgtE
MILKFLQFIKEELKISQINDKTLDVLKQNIKDKLIEYKTYLLSNIEVTDGQVVYKDFDRIEKRTIIRELNNEFTKEFIEDLKLDEFIENLDIIYSDRKNITIKKKIRKLFREYFQYLDGVEK